VFVTFVLRFSAAVTSGVNCDEIAEDRPRNCAN